METIRDVHSEDSNTWKKISTKKNFIFKSEINLVENREENEKVQVLVFPKIVKNLLDNLKKNPNVFVILIDFDEEFDEINR